MDYIVPIKCSNCGYKLKLIDGNYKCEACGSEFIIGNEVSVADDFKIVAGVLKEYTGSSSLIILPETIVEIGERCFADMQNIKSISFPSSIIKIGKEAFLNCTNLKQISFNNNLKEIGESAFKNTGLESVALPQNLISLGKDAFMWCKAMVSVDLTGSRFLSFDRAFKQCESLTTVKTDLSNYFPSFVSSVEVNKNGDIRSTFFDAFQGTPFFYSLIEKYKNKTCPICDGEIKANRCGKCGTEFKGRAKQGCYIATCVYGSYDCAEVWVLRRYRDDTLAKSTLGRVFIRVYYAISPTLVRIFGKFKWFKNFWKNILDRKIIKLKEKGVEDTPIK